MPSTSDPNVPVHSLFTRTPASPSQLCDNHSSILVDTIIPPEIRGVGTIRPEPHCDGFHDRIIFGKQGGLIQRAVPPDLHRGVQRSSRRKICASQTEPCADCSTTRTSRRAQFDQLWLGTVRTPSESTELTDFMFKSSQCPSRPLT